MEETRIEETWIEYQNFLRDKIQEEDNGMDIESITLIGGVDVSFMEEEEDTGDKVHGKKSSLAVASLVILSFPNLELIYEDYEEVELTVPYIPGFLAFREVEPLISLLNKVKINRADIWPQVVLVDGNGILHPRGCGLASHLGVEVDIPTIGCTKTFFHIDGLESQQEVRKLMDEQNLRLWMLQGHSGRIWGAAYRPPSIQNPIFISVGNGISLSKAVDIVKKCCRYRIPEPIRQADMLSRARLRNLIS